MRCSWWGIISYYVHVIFVILRLYFQFGWDALLETEVHNPEGETTEQSKNRARFNTQEFTDGGMERQGTYGSFDQIRMLGSDVYEGTYGFSSRV